ncbi:hypothetical protein [Mucilaginibacter rubeus]|uniref:Uncharacterized protein n=1 Tax=Mucilaginibacter rubeus TaxID=2027860 RepID=A0A5C1I202_9SPHI|nr:hypothetical protein [Mucilaginibacter rubeus]QEM11804.1 hypothetical protein DEO27_017810 [Mucilaginibacter rubeus]
MKFNFKTYLKHTYKTELVYLAVIAALYFYDNSNLIFLLFFPFSFIQGYYRYQYKLTQAEKLKARGLTEEDIENISFVKKWEHSRKRGMWNYCVIDGGFIFGLALSLITSIIWFKLSGKTDLHTLLSEPGDMFAFIGYNYMIGAGIAVIIFRMKWKYNEKRFVRLTDPLADNYFAKDYQDI